MLKELGVYETFMNFDPFRPNPPSDIKWTFPKSIIIIDIAFIVLLWIINVLNQDLLFSEGSLSVKQYIRSIICTVVKKESLRPGIC